MNKSKTGSEPQIITYDNTMSEINDIVGQLWFKNLYSLLGCARGLMKAQEAKGGSTDEK